MFLTNEHSSCVKRSLNDMELGASEGLFSYLTNTLKIGRLCQELKKL